MNPKLFAVLLCASLVLVVQARAKTILPEGCGDDRVNFKVKAEKDQPGPTGPAEGKAQIVFVETTPSDGNGMPTIRYGVDGAWAGANKGDSYFTFDVNPGVHNLCFSMQSAPSGMEKYLVDTVSITAESGRVYYFEAKFGLYRVAGITFGLSQLTDAEGRYRVKAWKLATWKSNQ